jgi:arylsulfatase A-like enzyme
MLKDSIPSYPPPLKAPQGAPNVLVILLDDVGFGHASSGRGVLAPISRAAAF